MDRAKEHIENGKTQDHHTELEEALLVTGSGKFHYLLLLVMGVGMMGVMMETFGSSFLLPSAQCDFHLSSSDKALLNALYPVGMILGSHSWGYIADTKGRRKVLMVAFALDGVCAILSSFSHEFWLFLIFRFLCGFIIVGSSSVIYAYVGEFYPLQTRNKSLVWLSIFIGLGIAVQPGIAWLIIPQTFEWYLPWCVYKSWRLFIVLCALPNITCALVLYLWLPETPKFLMSVGKNNETLEVLKVMYALNTGNNPGKYPVKSVILVEESATQIGKSGTGSIFDLFVDMWNQTVPLFRPPFLWKTLLACVVQYGLYASANGLSLWLPDIFNRQATYYSMYPDSHPSICQIFDPIQGSQLENSNDLYSLEFNKLNLQENDTLTFTCANNSLSLNVNNLREFQINQSRSVLQCENDILLHNLSHPSLQIDVNNGAIILTVINDTLKNDLFRYYTENSVLKPSMGSECNSNVDLSAFQNTLIIGAMSAISFVSVGYLIGPLGRTPILVGTLLIGGIAGLFLDYVAAGWEFFWMALVFVTLSGMCIPVMIGAVVEIFPTNVRAMAVCLSLMCGRMGSFTAHMLMGELLETNCLAMTYIFGCLCGACGILAYFLKTPKKIT